MGSWVRREGSWRPSEHIGIRNFPFLPNWHHDPLSSMEHPGKGRQRGKRRYCIQRYRLDIRSTVIIWLTNVAVLVSQGDPGWAAWSSRERSTRGMQTHESPLWATQGRGQQPKTYSPHAAASRWVGSRSHPLFVKSSITLIIASGPTWRRKARWIQQTLHSLTHTCWFFSLYPVIPDEGIGQLSKHVSTEGIYCSHSPRMISSP